MLSTSQAWKDMWATGTCALETQITIQGSVFPMTSAPILERAMMQSGPSVGNVVASSLRFSVIPDTPEASAYSDRTDLPIVDEFVVDTLTVAGTTIPKSAVVIVQMRLRDGSTSTEWQPVGRYFISHRSYDPVSNLLSIECYDALLKANGDITIAAGTTMSAAVSTIATTIGVQVDSRTTINTGSAYVIDSPEELPTMRDVLSFIGAAHGGNWIITPENKLRLVPLVSASGATPSSAVNVDGVLGGIVKRGTEVISGVRISSNESDTFYGNYTGTVITVNTPYMPDAIASALSNQLIGLIYQSYDLVNTVYDPAAELGDYVISKDDVASVLFNESRTLGIAFRSSINAPESAEIADEYPYIGTSDKAYSLAKTANSAAQGVASDLSDLSDVVDDTVVDTEFEYGNSASDQTAPTVWTSDASWEYGKYLWQRTKMTLADGSTEYGTPSVIAGTKGNGLSETITQYYLSTSAATPTGGTWSADIPTWVTGRYYFTRQKMHYSDGHDEYTTPELANGLTSGNQSTDTLDSSLNQQGVFNRLTNNGQTQGIFLDNGLLYINGTYLQIGTISDANGDNTWDLDNGILSTKQGYIGPFTITPAGLRYNIEGTSGNMYAADIGIGGISFRTKADSNSPWIKSELGDDSLRSGRFENGTFTGGELQFGMQTTGLGNEYNYWRFYFEHSLHMEFLGSGYDPITGAMIQVHKPVQCWDSFSVRGTKNRIVQTDQYSDRLLYCYETLSPLFGDVGEGVIGQDGNCYVWLDPVFAQTISTDQYQVFLQRYGTGDCYVSERKPGYFVVTGAPGLAFGWELKAKQKDYDQRRLDNADQPSAPTTTDYGKLAIDHITDIKKARDEV